MIILALWVRVPSDRPDQSTELFPPGMASTSAAEFAERFLDVRTAHDLDAARSFLADRVRVLPMADNEHDTETVGGWSPILDRDHALLALEAEEAFDLRYEPAACGAVGTSGRVSCSVELDSRLRRLEGLAPRRTSLVFEVHAGTIDAMGLPYADIWFDPGGIYPGEFEGFMGWLAFPSATAFPDPNERFESLFDTGGQEWIMRLEPDAVDLLATSLDEYERFATAVREDLDSALDGLVSAHPGGVSIVTRRGGVTAAWTAGDANGAGDPITTDTRFRIASLTKTFVATVVLQLADERSLDLDAPLSRYLPDTTVGGDIAIRALLGHRSGLPDYTESPEYLPETRGDRSRWFSSSEILDLVADMPAHAPGATSYSNTNYVLLGRLIERLEHSDLASALRRRIIDPLGLSATRLEHPSDPQDPELAGAWTSPGPGDLELRGDPADPHDSIASVAWAAGGMTSTPADLATFLHALVSGELVSPDAFAEMLPDRDEGVGLGLFIADLGAWGRAGGSGAPVVGNAGWIDGYRSMMAIDPATGDAVIVLANADAIDPAAFVRWVTVGR
ncbi:serine hydrolase domain-containing protein [Agromyces binzhouensis]|uniref:Class A beta-lactamase-related serine hydrolase n=1 Tax=Agromyces binzhouensis TaxID=1817495 RepID=A0A4Q2JUA7_9MICO|nr:serine hydrolase domain-containing protein [Agromyces binzhouensis]RXZ51832.1 class A beta-lactamase-related serine hydrolase [Agromyces binzhouensis]